MAQKNCDKDQCLPTQKCDVWEGVAAELATKADHTVRQVRITAMNKRLLDGFCGVDIRNGQRRGGGENWQRTGVGNQGDVLYVGGWLAWAGASRKQTRKVVELGYRKSKRSPKRRLKKGSDEGW
jgi:hypothetical protein